MCLKCSAFFLVTDWQSYPLTGCQEGAEEISQMSHWKCLLFHWVWGQAILSKAGISHPCLQINPLKLVPPVSGTVLPLVQPQQCKCQSCPSWMAEIWVTTSPTFLHPRFPGKGTQVHILGISCSVVQLSLESLPSLDAWMPPKWPLCGISRSACQVLGNPFLMVAQCWQRAVQDMGQGTLKHTAWDDPAPLLYACFQREYSIMSKYKKHLFLYQRGQIMGSNTCSLHVKVRCLIKQSP